MINSVQECDQIVAMREEVRKMKEDLEASQKLITNQCEQNLLKSPNTVYQTNLYNNNKWILGSMTMDDLIN